MMEQQEEPSLADLWGGLEQEIEAAPPGAEITAPAAAARRPIRSVVDRARSAGLSGWTSMFCLLTVSMTLALLLRSPGPYRPQDADEMRVLFCLVPVWTAGLAALLAPLLRIDRGSGLRTAGVALLAGTFGALAALGPTATMWAAAQSTIRPSHVLETCQRFMEASFSLGAFLLYAALGFAAHLAMRRQRRRLPWLELPPAPGRARTALAWCLVLLPSALLLAAATVQLTVAPAVDGWVERTEALVSSRGVVSSHDPAWSELQQRLRGSGPALWKGASASWSTLRTRQAESEALRLWAATPAAGKGDAYYAASSVLIALLEKSGQLVHPEEVAEALVRLVLQVRPGYPELAFRRAWTEVLLPRLSQQRYTAAELSARQAELESLEALCLDPRQELDVIVLDGLEHDHPLFSRGARGMRLLGVEVPFSLEKAAQALYRNRVLGPWPAVREKLDVRSEEALQASLDAVLRSGGPIGRHNLLRPILRQAEAARCYGLCFRPYLQTGRLISSLRLYKMEHGAYPATLQELNTELPVQSWSYAPGKDGGASLSRSGETETGRSKDTVLRWRLP
jgi:hypothetical protein